MIRLIFLDGSRYIVSRLFVSVIMFVSIPIIIGLIGIDTYGEYSRIVALATAIASFSFAWVYQTYLRYGNNDMSFQKALYLYLISSTLLSIALIVYCYINIDSIKTELLVLICALSIGIYQIFRVHLQTKRLIRLFSIFEFFRAIILAGGPIAAALAVGSLGFEGMIVIVAIANTVYAAGLYFIYGRNWTTTNSIQITTKKVCLYGMPIAIWLGLASTMNYIDRSLVITYHGADSGGLFAAYSDIYNRIGALVIIPVSTAILPIVFSIKNSDQAFSRSSYYLMLISLCTVSSALAMVAIQILSTVYDSKINLPFQSIDTFILLTGFSLWQASILMHKILEVSGNTRMMVVFITIALLVHYLAMYSMGIDKRLSAISYAYFASGLTYAFLCWASGILHTRKTVGAV